MNNKELSAETNDEQRTAADLSTSANVEANQMLAELQKGFKAEYMIDGKKVSEYRFFKSIANDLKGKKKRQVFYWTDEKVLLLLECLEIKITKKTLAEFKANFL